MSNKPAGLKIPLLIDTGTIIAGVIVVTLMYARIGDLERKMDVKVDYYTKEIAERDLKLRDQEIASLKETLRRIERKVDPSTGWRPQERKP
jgi:hypothetical protein